MIFNKHSELAGRHATLSPSKSSWLRYDEEKMARVYLTQRAAARGTRLHHIAQQLIDEGIKLGETGQTLNRYVNDCIGFRMLTEVPVYATEHAFGTADAMSFRQNILRISDLKTGEKEADEEQLEVYAAYFCIEYAIRPFDIERIELRIYQNDDCVEYVASPVDISLIIDKTLAMSKFLDRLRREQAL